MKNPFLTINIEVREKGIYVYFSMQKGPGGLPVGSSGKGMLLLSGGIDSPCAGWLLLKRGMSVLPLHFISPPYTSPRAKQKVINLAKKLVSFGGERKLLVINFTPIHLKIKSTSRKELTTLLVRKAMFQIADKLCNSFHQQAIITGENLGQVASQTIESMTATSYNNEYPILRPLIAYDKYEIINLAKQIDTYETSILPYEDCCTLFLPDNPRTKPKIFELEKEYDLLDLDSAIDEVVNNLECIELV